MAEFLTTRGTGLQIENIIKNAKRQLFLISPYIRFPETLLQSLQDADRRKIKITLVYGKRKLKPDERSPLEQLAGLSIYFLENLHAKCIFNEELMVITSMNLYDSSERDNREMGVLISKDDDKKLFNDAVEEAKLILHSATKDESRIINRISMAPSGFCIRCGTAVPLNLDKPLCSDCFSEWNIYENPDYEENFCHICGRQSATTKDKPLCRTCYNQL